jgi:hypothetical protein
MKHETYTHKSGAAAGHVSDGGNHAAFVKALHVMLCEDGGGWFAQGVEIDYCASGKDLDEAKQNFADGLALTVNEHLKMHGNLKKILKGMPHQGFEEFLKTPPKAIEQLSFLTAVQMFEKAKVDKPKEKAEAFPFEGLAFTGHKAAVPA